MEQVLRWWDGVELWVAGQGFVPQVVLMLAVVIPLAWLTAGALDRVISSGQIRGRKLSDSGKPALPKSWVTWALVILLVLVLLGWMTR
ncbi:GTP-binding protein [Segniliparus rugosus]|uniref:GTP-binding protein n=1 Tax=Segniliparus rugosus TaxID=286804 RepID=UPI0012EBA85B|nr:GTP-binding protein [Segniliparus rugosus]